MASFVAAFDLATQVGCADGLTTAGTPRLWTWCLVDAGEGRPRRLAFLRRFVDAYLEKNKADIVVYEKPLGIAVIASLMAKGQYRTSEDVLGMLRGAVGVLEAGAAFAGVQDVRSIDVKDARGHLVGRRTFPGGDAKAATMRACRALGWDAQNYDESDAAALWSLAVGQANPRLAGLTRGALVGSADVPMTTGRGARAKRPRNPGLFENG